VQDGFAALQWIAQHADEYSIDVENIYGYGYSAGGHLVSLIAVSEPRDWLVGGETDSAEPPIPKLRAVAVGGAPCDFQWIGPKDERLEYWLGGTPTEVPETYEAVTVLDNVGPESPPFFLFHARDDLVVPVACSQRMQHALQSHDVACELLVVEESSHLAAFNSNEALDRVVEFFQQHTSRR
jgi:acetyl esterase/lipase